MYHDVNILTARSCDFVLTACPHSSLKFNKKGYKSIFIPMEADGDIFKKYDSIEKNIDSSLKVTSPIVGTAYLAPEPGAKKFVEEGQKIKKGQTIMIVEAMKTMNHVPSTQNGIVSKVLVKDGDPVEFGQPLISIK